MTKVGNGELDAAEAALQRGVRLVEAFLRYFNPNDLPEDSSMQWQQLEHWAKTVALAAPVDHPEVVGVDAGSMPEGAKWCQPGDMQDERRYLVRFDDPEMPDAVFADWGNARDFYTKATLSWNCWLFASVPVAAPVDHPEV